MASTINKPLTDPYRGLEANAFASGQNGRGFRSNCILLLRNYFVLSAPQIVNHGWEAVIEN